MKRLVVCTVSIVLLAACSSEQTRTGGGTTTVAGSAGASTTSTTGGDPSATTTTVAGGATTTTVSPGCSQPNLLVRGDGIDTPCPVVTDMQRRLVVWDNVITIDGQFGPGSEAAVKAFQSAQGLPVTGQVDTATWTALQVEPPVKERFLRHDGIGAARFSNTPGAVIDYFSTHLGRPTSDTGWEEASSEIACISSTLRVVTWIDLRLYFADLPGGKKWVGYESSAPGATGTWRTEKGLKEGDTTDRLLSLYPDASISPDYFETSIGLWGWVDIDTGRVLTIGAGQLLCGE